MIVLSQWLLPAIIQNFACNILTVKDDIDIVFVGVGGAAITIFPEFLEKCGFCVLLNEIVQKFICKIYIIINNSYT